MPTGTVQSVFPEINSGFISAGREGGPALRFSFSDVIGDSLMPGDHVRFLIGPHDRASYVELIPKVRK